jgi:phage gpG-like protein
MRETIGVMYPRYAKFFQRKDQRFSFEERRLYGHSGFYLQWQTRPHPELTESYENQQTSVGTVVLERSAG